MSDWGAVHGWHYALNRLDQESGVQLDATMNGAECFTEPLRKASAETQPLSVAIISPGAGAR